MGALSDILSDLPNVPIYGSRFTLEIIKMQLEEDHIKKANLKRRIKMKKILSAIIALTLCAGLFLTGCGMDKKDDKTTTTTTESTTKSTTNLSQAIDEATSEFSNLTSDADQKTDKADDNTSASTTTTTAETTTKR